MTSGIRKVGVIGMGLMGSGIAQVAAARKFETVVMDVSPEIISKGMERIRDSIKRMVAAFAKTDGKSGIAPEEESQIFARIKSSVNLHDVLQCDAIVEAVVEDEAAKKNLIRSLAQMGSKNFLVSNTSSISITRLGAVYSEPEKFMGMHFMNPVPIQPGCELIRGLFTSDETFQTIVSFCRDLGKEPILAEDKAGFGINRMFVPFLNEAVKLIEEGVMSCEDADKTTICLGHKMGPITTMDYVGLDTTLAIAQVLEKELGPAYKPADLLSKLVSAGFLGAKNGRGFYFWEGDKKSRVNPAVERYRRK
ncbi:MAG TPA: 3-hydroxyacyl-CoA dehydrogenase NAD-binding domain-containing protein [Candidatus Binatia bacterium]|nr:3-hydroxyacyl-CoA dehydrogenase NAD-binding domain-containing protein [Candidatus Binatia bacterium]